MSQNLKFVEEIVEAKENWQNDYKLLYYVDENGVKQGSLKKFLIKVKQDQLVAIQNYKNDKLDGLQENYYDGKITGIYNYKEGVKDGPFQEFPNAWSISFRGDRREGHYKNDLLEGTVNEYYSAEDKSEKLAFTGDYRAGIKHGRHKAWCHSGNPYFDNEYDLNGKSIGTHTRWHSNGNKEREVIHSYDENGHKEEITTWFPHGGKKAERTLLNSRRVGWATLYLSKNGSVSHRNFYENGKCVTNPDSEEDARMILYLENKGYTVVPPEEKMDRKNLKYRYKVGSLISGMDLD